MAEEQTLEVTIQNIVFQSDQGTFCVFRGENRDLGAVSVVYKGIAPFAGEKVRLTGSWTEHPRFGRQFDCRTWEALKPTGEAAIVKMLGSGAIKGVGPEIGRASCRERV